ncbi:serine hydrolase domain-containing protein [Nocardia arthritidis]|uniref:Serine hydrolase n=1 Tax=Nocardia arthritidis TaxID=228602 RepID=A0A6G9Y769_9NOCA|nr:serine hydrolase domain-containing protein [Nocardia arthritidis]QIS08903.1 serine hydrolase [Nocardia arthritidis]
MRVGIRFGLILAVLLLLLPPPAGSAEPDLDRAAVDRFVTDYMAHTRLPGVAIAITHGARVLYVKGYGHDSTGAAITADTPMPIASVSKSFAALAIMQLVDAGKVDLDEPVQRYLADFRLADPRGSRITVRELLNQRSGMSDTAFPDLRRPQAHNLAEAVSRLHEARLADDPGTEFHYHNPNYQVVARIVEVVGGMPYADYLREHLLIPLGMRATSTVDTARDAKDIAHGYVRAYGIPIPVSEPDWFVGGSHGMITTASDLAPWLIAQNNGGVTADGGRLVSTAAIDLMHKPVGRDEYGMGWRRKQSGGPEQIFHTGDWFTYTAEQLLLPESGYGIAVLADTGLALQDDPPLISDGLVAITQGHTPDVRRPWGIYADWLLAIATVGVLAFGVGCVIRARRWADRQNGRPAWLVALRLAPFLLPPVILLLLPDLSGLVFAGRSGTFVQVMYVWPALVVLLGVATVSGLTVFIARGIRLWLRKNRAAPSDKVGCSPVRISDNSD